MEKKEILKGLKLHDTPIDNISFVSKENRINFLISIYDDEQNAYDNFSLNFIDIEQVVSSKIDFSLFDELEITSCSAKKIESKYLIELNMQTRPSEASWVLTINCKKIEIVKVG